MSLLAALLEEDFAGDELASKKEVWLAIRTDGAAGSGTQDNPYNVSTAERFDEIMREIVEENTVIHIGPGVFRTAGFGLGTPRWRPKSGQTIIGSGISTTTLLYIADIIFGATDRDAAVIAHDHTVSRLQDWEISDLTIDCNLQNQRFNPAVMSFPQVAIKAIAVAGDNIIS